MRTESETIKVFYADDGTRFLSADECRSYEDEQRARAARMSSIRFYAVAHSPDTTEGRGWYGRLHIAVEPPKYGPSAETFALTVCFALFGLPLAWVQGVSVTENWSCAEETREAFESWREDVGRVGDTRSPARAVFVSDGEAIPGWPRPLKVNAMKTADLVLAALSSPGRA